ncbi:CDP-alcohol phosphatidyltransferase family protein [Desulfobotulus sp. H1]|uniref:CDP-alcohol phosphatidyltransferase family protein n=1 Tax=Desulfobotulus pelophilus TaxID=2823377 RepID=A0ABT3N809_9BACT|nr:CDP-alcohol phosphatidyltransferase family protein [Desulfobotulus pelophilus]MCW7753591.1 CDP-alcohol phosphatidyltransferase family protein [Desulfobotulus pelophilus]
MLDSRLRPLIQPLLNLMVRPFVLCGVTAMHLTFMAFAMGMVAAFCLLQGYPPLWAVIFLWASGLFDMLDGALARRRGTTSEIGAFLDVLGDRCVEVAVIVCLAIMRPELRLVLIFLLAALLVSVTVLLLHGALSPGDTRASFRYQPGLAERSEGFLFFTLIILFPRAGVFLTLLFTLLVTLSAGQRIMESLMLFRLQGRASADNGNGSP